MAVNIKFLADVVNLIRGLGQSREAVEDNAEALEDVSRQAIELGLQMGKTTDEIARDWTEASGIPFDRTKRAVEEVERATRDLERAQGDAADAAEEMADTTADAAQDAARKTADITDGTDQAKDGLTELGQLARDILAGDFESAADTAIGSLSGLAAAAGVGGAVGGAVLEAVGGLVSQLIKAWDPFNEKTREVAGNVTAALVDVGGAFDKATIEERLRSAAADTETWNQAVLLAKATNMDLADALRAVAGVSQEESAGAFEALQAAMNDASSAAQNLNLYALRDLEQQLKGNADGFSDAQTRLDVLQGALDVTDQQAREAAQGVKSLWDQVKNPPKDPTVKVDIDTAAAERKWTSFVQRVSGTTVRVRGAIVAPDGTRLLE